MRHHDVFADSLLAMPPLCPPGLTAWNGSDPARRFAVYRNNVMVSLIDALAETFPVTQALVGAEFFRAMAGLFARAHPPRSPVMAHYGADLAEFIEGFQPAAGLTYLPDVARLEMLRVEAFHAADAHAIPPERLGQLVSVPERLPAARFALHPSLRTLVSPHAVVSIWAVHQAADIDSTLAAVDTTQPESALILRAGLEVETWLVTTGAAVFIEHLLAESCLGDAAEQALAADAAFDLSDALGLLLRRGAITGVVQ